MAFAIIKTGGKQYRVSQGIKFDVEKLDAEVGSSITLDQVLFYGTDGESRVGDPLVEGASVTATVLDQHRDKKVINFKFKRRKGFHKTKGHRRHLTRLQVESINL
ncbi:MAG: rplU [Verrucomicrobiales bacterium]|nr:rplU [Verrucomicrobiales bacterium]